jgi:lipoate-protein ligase A
MIPVRLLDTGLLSAPENMALDEILTRRVGQGSSPPTLRFLQFSPEAALLGYHQEAARELRLDYCRDQGIDINRRLTGGGSLLFQSSALGWELIAPLGTGPFKGGFENALTRICRAAARGLSRMGIEARFRPRNDIEVDGRKISGTGGFVLEGGALFQGTVLITNEIERFLRALRVPVEKLRKREIESLMERMAFLEDLLGGPVDMAALKQALAREFKESLDFELTPGALTPDESAALKDRLPFFQSEEWVQLKRPPSQSPAWLRDLLQTDAGTLQVNLWLDRRGRLLQKALISGDFFSQPQRLVFDLEAFLMGKKADPGYLQQAVLDFFAMSQGELVGIAPDLVALAISRAASRRVLAPRFSPEEAAELFFVSFHPAEIGQETAGWLLLPYCAKPVDCELRQVPDCNRCGECDFDPLYTIAEDLGLKPVSIQSFEHLMEVLADLQKRGEIFVGSCCEAFYTKHQKEMEQCGARGVLVNLDSTTCYDLGKGMEAYVGDFNHQTFMNLGLIQKVCQEMSLGRDR